MRSGTSRYDFFMLRFPEVMMGNAVSLLFEASGRKSQSVPPAISPQSLHDSEIGDIAQS